MVASPLLHPMVSYVGYFLFVNFVVALATSLIRMRDPKAIIGETIRFFLMIVVSIGILGVLVAVVEWLFIRPLI
jgi:hypothetical protein